jgi:HK97 family phage major capsid protein
MNGEYIEREFEAYRKDDAEARAILDLAASEQRATTTEEDERFDRLVTSAAVHKSRADRLATMDTDGTDLAEKVRARIGETHDTGSGGSEITGGDAALVTTVRSLLSAIKTGSERRGEVIVDLPFNFEAPELRVLTGFDDGTSLYTSDFQTRVAVYQRTMSPWISQGTIINANNGRPLIIPTSTVDPTSYTPGEGTAITASDPTLGTATATPVSYKALGYLSAEAEEDEVVGLMQVLSYQQGRSLGLAFGSAATTAILAAASNGGTATGLTGGGTATFVGYEDLLDLKYGRAAPYRLAGAWVMSNGMIKKARKYTDTNGQYLWQPAIAAGQPDLFDGQAVFEDPYLAAPASVTKSVLYGDLSQFVIKQMPLRVAVSTEFAFNLDNVAIKSVYRAGGAVVDAAALAFLVSADT